MARTISRAILIAVLATALTGCESVMQKATGYFLKERMIEICGQDDKACLAAVDAQYDACEKKYQKEWSAYLHAGPEKEDALMEVYLSRLFSCVVDQDGVAYFAYKPD